MSLKSFLASLWASHIRKKIDKWAQNPITTQEKVFKTLIQQAKNTAFGKDHRFAEIHSYEDFVKNVPIRDYEALSPYIERVKNAEENVLWRGKPLYFAKTSGTTSGAKYIPLTKESMPYHIQAARDAILCYIAQTGKADFVSGKMIFLQGSPILEKKNGILLGRLSGISAHYVPKYLQSNRMPSWETNCIEDWETKVDAIVQETIQENMTVISGIPPWVQMYFERLQAKSHKTIGELFPNFQLFIYGGVNYEPYRQKFEHLIGRKVDAIELYPASEGFFAYQDSQTEKGMLLLLNAGIFYEFVEADTFFSEQPKRISLKDVELDVNYVLIVSTNAGLWAYNMGDTVMFTSLNPYRIIVTGRIKHFISAFGEHVIAKEVEQAIAEALREAGGEVTEFTVAPQVNPSEGELPYHEWFIEFESLPKELSFFASALDKALQKQNSYYKDLIEGKVLQPLKITCVPKDGFSDYMKTQGKLGGQNKAQHLANDRNIVDKLPKI
ncbi:GH3 auxin-responsive promoter family protein [uncultured Capnocytophaga sp.]|mgnify:FL=1|uniref:GH3 auxin-responsive promoter family protein n=1 Tax=uncultured Capnocytophaga sp. TaxID=159273 RepID=UPI00260AE1D3|nr:GH3 auxin-responsive promoter family protein [uncultured Capnocytophaga sp.]